MKTVSKVNTRPDPVTFTSNTEPISKPLNKQEDKENDLLATLQVKNRPELQQKINEITAKSAVETLERDVRKIADDMLAKTKDVIYVKNEVRQTFVTNKNPSSRDIVGHYIEKLKAEIDNSFERKRKANDYLSAQIEVLKSDNLDLNNRVIMMKSRLDELESQFGNKKR